MAVAAAAMTSAAPPTGKAHPRRALLPPSGPELVAALIVTLMGADATPFATTCRMAAPSGPPTGTVKFVLTVAVPVATAIVLCPNVRQYQMRPVAGLRSRTSG